MMLLSYHSSPVRAAATVCEMPAGSPSVPAAGAPPDDAVKYIGGARGPQRWEEDGCERSSSVGVSGGLCFFDAAVSTRADLILVNTTTTATSTATTTTTTTNTTTTTTTTTTTA